jgi:hypothetical protein
MTPIERRANAEIGQLRFLPEVVQCLQFVPPAIDEIWSGAEICNPTSLKA